MINHNSYHVPIFVNQIIELFSITDNSTVIDATLGFGGHASEILQRFPSIQYIGFDRDSDAIGYSNKRCASFNGFKSINDSFSTIPHYIKEMNITPTHILLDLGISSYQIDQSNRGFTFQKDEPLDMRMDILSETSAADVLNDYSADHLSQIFRDYSDIRFPDRLVTNISSFRNSQPFITTQDLISCVKKSFYFKSRRQYIAMLTKVFQAIRVEVNQELDQLKLILDFLLEVSTPLTVGIITFQPNEDRLLKSFIKDNKLEKVNKRPIQLKYNECKDNPRAKSASLRVFNV